MLEKQELKELFNLDVWQNQIQRFCLEDYIQELQQEVLSYRKVPYLKIEMMEQFCLEAAKLAYAEDGFSPDNPPAPSDLDLGFPGEVTFILSILRDFEKILDTQEKLRTTKYPPSADVQKKILDGHHLELERSIGYYLEWKKGHVPFRILLRAELLCGLRKYPQPKEITCTEQPDTYGRSQFFEDHSKSESVEALNLLLSTSERNSLRVKLIEHGMIEQITQLDFDTALTSGKNHINWLKPVTVLSYLVFQLHLKGKMGDKPFWGKVSTVFQVKGKNKNVGHLSNAHGRVSAQHKHQIDTLLRRVISRQ